MKKYLFFSILIIIAHTFYGQDSLLVGKKYFEDQLYIGVSTNTFFGKPDEFKQHGISPGFQVGFIKDIPINKNRNLGFGLGVGYAVNNYKQNLKIPEFLIVDIVPTTDANSYTTHAIEFPFSFRFRTSTTKIHPFFRVYVGAKISYIFASKSIFTSETELENNTTIGLPLLNRWQYGPQATVGYGNLNVYLYMLHNNIFNSNPISTGVDATSLREYRIGLQFYIF